MDLVVKLLPDLLSWMQFEGFCCSLRETSSLICAGRWYCFLCICLSVISFIINYFARFLSIFHCRAASAQCSDGKFRAVVIAWGASWPSVHAGSERVWEERVHTNNNNNNSSSQVTSSQQAVKASSLLYHDCHDLVETTMYLSHILLAILAGFTSFSKDRVFLFSSWKMLHLQSCLPHQIFQTSTQCSLHRW